MKFCISGGHLTPALAFIDHIKEQHPEDDCVFLGRLFSKSGDSQESQEKKAVEQRKILFIPFSSAKLTQDSLLHRILSVPGVLWATGKAIYIVRQQKPDVFISFGGYLAIPIALAMWLLRVPIITHEQTRVAGFANIIIAKFARYIAVSYPESEVYFPKNRTVVTGNLVRKSVLMTSKQLPEWLQKKPRLPVLYITGGSQGSEIINRTVEQILPALTRQWCVIHQCGKPTTNSNYKQELESARLKLSKTTRENYYVREWITESELAYIYTQAYCVVARAGANTTEELMLRALPTLFIPLPFSHNDEQQKNVLALTQKNQALILEQKNLNPETLLESLAVLKKQHKKIQFNLQLNSRPQQPESALYDLAQQTQKS